MNVLETHQLKLYGNIKRPVKYLLTLGRPLVYSDTFHFKFIVGQDEFCIVELDIYMNDIQ